MDVTTMAEASVRWMRAFPAVRWAVAGAMCMAAGSVTMADEPALALSRSGGAITVSVPANSYDDTSKLYLVWGSGDSGEKFSAWPRTNHLEYNGAISSAAATYQFSDAGIPAGSVVRAIVTSDVRLIDGWVLLGDGQYINTGIKGNAAYGVDFRYRRTGANGNWASVIGSRCDNFTVGQHDNTSNKFYLRYRTGEAGNPMFTISDTSVPHTFKIFNRTCWLDGTQVKKDLAEGTIGTDGDDILVGSSSNGSNTSGRYCYGEWHYVRVFDANGYDMLHLVPAIRGNSSSPEGVFYDKVTGKCFANAGSGSPGYDASATVIETIKFTTACSAAFPLGMTALWTGAGDLTNVNDPANWTCTDSSGAVVANAVPDVNTIVSVKNATNFSVPAGQKLAYNELNFENCSLAADCDWRGLASVDTVGYGVTLQYLDAPKGAYIDTGFAPNNNTRVVFDITVRGTLESWFGITDDSSGNWWKTKCFGVSNDGRNVYSGFGNSGGGNGSPVAVGRHTLDYDKGVFKVDGVTHTSRSGQTFQLTRTLYLFADHRPNDVNIKNNNPPVRLHSCKIYDNDVLVRDYVPVRNGDAVGLYDRVNGEFAMNIGSGAFAAGPVIGEKVGFYPVTGPAAIDATIDLAGHSLALAHAAGDGTITDTIGGGELHFDVASGETVENKSLAFTGQMKLVKDGAGTFLGTKADQTYTGGTVANAGWLKQGAYSGSWGPHKSLITIQTGAGFDWNGKVNDSSTTAYSFKIAGTGPDGDAAMKTSVDLGGNYWNANYIADMELDDDATVKACQTYLRVYGFVYRNAFGHNLNMNDHTLTVAAGDSFAFRGVTATEEER